MIQLVYAHGTQGEFGFQQGLPWNHIPQDFKNFKARTTNTILVMGSNTFASLPTRLPDRKHIVFCDFTRDAPIAKDNSSADSYINISEFDKTLEFMANDKLNTYSVIGGAGLLAKALKYADKVIHTEVKANYLGADTFLCNRFMSMVRCMPKAEQHEYFYLKSSICETIRLVDKDFVIGNFKP